MGTRSTVKFYSEFNEDECIAAVYQQFDGYISGVGRSLAEFLKAKTMINGIGVNQDMPEFANGMGCLAAQFVREFKSRCGGTYMTSVDALEDYNYEVRMVNGALMIKVDEFHGTPEELISLAG